MKTIAKVFAVLGWWLLLSSQSVAQAAQQDGGVLADDDTSSSVSYGLDVSFPILNRVSTNYPHLEHNQKNFSFSTPRKYENMPLQILGDRQEVYLDHLDGCREYYSETGEGYLCDTYEYDRMLMNKRQPQSMINLTETGFKKIRAPEHLRDLIEDFWNKNKDKKDLQQEAWGAGNSYVNHWNQPTTLVSVDDTGLRGSGQNLKRHIWSAASATLEEWTQQELQPCSLYGIRVYHEGAIMLPHVDRLPLVASAMIGVAQDVDEDWPLEIYDHDGRAHNITINPGDMLLFESHSVIHGHPFPLKGKFHAMIFIHFEPTGHPLRKNENGSYSYLRSHEDDGQDEEGEGNGSKKQLSKSERSKKEKDVEKQHHVDTLNGIGGQSSSISAENHLPPYIKRESPEEAHWLQQHPDGWTPVSIRKMERTILRVGFLGFFLTSALYCFPRSNECSLLRYYRRRRILQPNRARLTN